MATVMLNDIISSTVTGPSNYWIPRSCLQPLTVITLHPFIYQI